MSSPRLSPEDVAATLRQHAQTCRNLLLEQIHQGWREPAAGDPRRAAQLARAASHLEEGARQLAGEARPDGSELLRSAPAVLGTFAVVVAATLAVAPEPAHPATAAVAVMLGALLSGQVHVLLARRRRRVPTADASLSPPAAGEVAEAVRDLRVAIEQLPPTGDHPPAMSWQAAVEQVRAADGWLAEVHPAHDPDRVP